VRFRFSSFGPRVTGGLLALLALLAVPREARAEPSSWLAVGGGYAFQRNGAADYDARAAALSVTLGVGTSSRNALVVGGVLRSVTYFSLGTDLGLAARVASGGFARGDWGIAVDLGVAGRWWARQEYGHFPVQAVVTGGLPWGLQVGVGADLWDVSGDSPKARGGFAVLELDLLRFTVMRNGATTAWWPNPSAADVAPPREAPLGP
jgi:hypothetical protein